jgi:hypothetical protein
MGLDLRMPIGLMFSLLGAMTVVYGLVSDAGMYERSLGINVNLWWGLVMLLFGLVFLYFGRRGTSAMRPAETTPEGRATELEEFASGKERRNPVAGEGQRPAGH